MSRTPIPDHIVHEVCRLLRQRWAIRSIAKVVRVGKSSVEAIKKRYEAHRQKHGEPPDWSLPAAVRHLPKPGEMSLKEWLVEKERRKREREKARAERQEAANERARLRALFGDDSAA